MNLRKKENMFFRRRFIDNYKTNFNLFVSTNVTLDNYRIGNASILQVGYVINVRLRGPAVADWLMSPT